MSGVVSHKCDVLVVGGGASGALAALRAKELGVDVLLVDKSVFGRSGCAALASGALRVYLPGDELEQHLKGRGDLVDERMAVEAIYAYNEVYRRLEDAGVPFVKEDGKLWRGNSPSGGLDAALLGGGPAMMMAVRREALKRGIKVLSRIMITDVLTSDGKLPTKGRVVGAMGVGVRDSQVHVFEAKAVVMCAGGFSFPYPKAGEPFSGMPIDLSGDGVAAELRSGAVMGNLAIGGMYYHAKEFFTAPGLEHFSMQGVKWVNRLGEDVMEKYKKAESEFTRRHTLNAAIALEVRAGRGPVSLDCTHFKPEQFRFLWDVIPIIMSNYERAGYDLSKERVPYLQVTSGVHGFNYSGGAVIDRSGKTSIPGLYAAGSCSNGVYVRTNLALDESFVTGLWAGEGAAKYALSNQHVAIVPEQVERLKSEVLKPLNLRDGMDQEVAHEKLAQIFIELSSIPNTAKIKKSLENVQKFNAEVSPKIQARDSHYLVKALMDKNVAQVLVVVLKYLLHRKESRGSSINEDYPEIDNDNWRTWTESALRENGELEIWDVPIPENAYVNRKPFKGKRIHPIFEPLRSDRK